MRLLNVCGPLLALQSLSLLALPTQASEVYISEVLADPPPGLGGDANGDGKRDSYQDEFVELFNADERAISLAGWRICDDDTPWDRAFVFPPNTVLPPASYIVLFGGGTPPHQDGKTFVDDGRIGNGLSNRSDVVLLINAERDTVDRLAGTPWPKDQSLTRSESGSTAPHTAQSTAPFSPGTQPGGRTSLTPSSPPRVDSLDTTSHSIPPMDAENSIQGTGEAPEPPDEIPARTETPPNRAPHIFSTPRERVYASGRYAYQVQASDLEGATLVYVLAEAPEGWRLHYASGLLNGRAPAQPGTYPVALEVIDGQGGIAHQVFSLQVLPRPRVRISEILADPPLGLSGDANGDGVRHGHGDEFVELFNAGNDPIDLDGMHLGDEHSASFTFPPRSRLDPGQHVAVFGSYRGSNRNFFSSNGRIGNGLDNLRDRVYLLSPDSLDTLAHAGYSLSTRPRQSLHWDGERFSLHTTPGVQTSFSPGHARPTIAQLRLASAHLSMIQGERRSPTLFAQWSTGRQVRITEGAQWTTSDSSVLSINPSDGTLQALKPGYSLVTAQIGSHTTPTQSVTVHSPLNAALSFVPNAEVMQMRRGERRPFSLSISDEKPLNFTWFLNGRRIPKRSKQVRYTCCLQALDTLRVDMKRGAQRHSKQWIIRDKGAAKTTREPWAVRAHPNPFNTAVHFTVFSASSTPISLRIYDLRGHLVHQLDRATNGNSVTLQWNGRNSDGQRVSSGVYLYVVEQGPFHHAGKVLFIK